MKGYIYKYTYPNGKVYIGQTTTSIEKRWSEHISSSKSPECRMLCDVAINKYGAENIKIDILEEVEFSETKPAQLIEKLNELEKKYISDYDSTNICKGYNIREGGEREPIEQKILEEAWYDLYNKENWEDSIAQFRYILYECIKPKLFRTKEKLNKEERYVWYGYKFLDPAIKKEITFSGFFKRYKDLPVFYDIGDFECDENGKLIEPGNKDEWVFGTESRGLISEAVKNWIEDIKQTLWRKINKRKNQIIKEYRLNYKTKNL